MPHILLVEDDTEFAVLLTDFLETQLMTVRHVREAEGVVELLKREAFDLILMDIGLVCMDGLTLSRHIRKVSDIAIIVSSARGDVDDKLKAFEIGADDYMAKPYDPRELLARIHSLLKRVNIDEELIFCINEEERKIYKHGVALELTRAEYEIFSLFLAHPGCVIRRDEIANRMESHRFESGIESINVLVGRLRKKITDTKSTYIETIRGMGYRFES